MKSAESAAVRAMVEALIATIQATSPQPIAKTASAALAKAHEAGLFKWAGE